jgi:hypothetical protein
MVEFLDQHRDQLACADRSSRGYCGLPLQQTALHPNVRIALAEPRDQVDRPRRIRDLGGASISSATGRSYS